MQNFIVRYRQHLIFWGVAFLGSFFFMWSKVNFYDALVRAIVNGLLVLGLVYFNIRILVPRLFKRDLYLVFILVSVVFLVMITALRFYVDILFLPYFPTIDLVNNLQEGRWIIYYWAMSNFQFYVSLVYSISIDLNREKQYNAELERQRLDAELKFLKSQLRPHFLLNTLNNVYTLTYLNHARAPQMLMQLSESLKYLLYEGENEQVTMLEEVNFIESFIELNKLRLERPERIHFSYSGPLAKFVVPPLIFLAFIENAFKHSDTEENEFGYVRLDLSIDTNGKISFRCENTVRLARTNLKEKSGIGLQNVRQRLEILFGNDYTMQIYERRELFTVLLTFTAKSNIL